MPTTASLFAEPDVEVEERSDGSWLLRSRTPLRDCVFNIARSLEHWARERPTAPLLCERDGADWRIVTYGEAWTTAVAIGQALLERGLGPERPVMALSANSIDHGVLMLGCYVSGIPFVPVSAAYSLQSTDFGKLRHTAGLTRPGAVFAEHRAPFADALAAIAGIGAEIVTSDGGDSTTTWSELAETPPGSLVADAFAAIDGDTVAKILFTSGSTGTPKGVVNTQRMLCTNQQALAQVWPFLEQEPPVLVDWLPWSHTFGGNNNFNLVLRNGGTLYIDAGKPAPGLIDISVENLRSVSPTIYQNVPAGFAALLPHLEADEDLAAHLFERLRLSLYAAAALPRDVWDRYDAVARRITGRPAVFTSAWGATETGPLATAAHFPLDAPGNIGVPVPGVTIKLVPDGRKLELRVQGPNVTPGYLGEPALTDAAYDEEGFYRTGDAGRFADPDEPTAGIAFDGRIAEDFKLTTGTWVSAGTVRTAILSASAPLVLDAVITGHDRDEVGALVWISAPAAERLFGLSGPIADVLEAAEVRAYVCDSIREHNSTSRGSSTRVARLLLVAEPPQLDAGEITDKGYINQRAVLERRVADVARLHRSTPDDDVLVL